MHVIVYTNIDFSFKILPFDNVEVLVDTMASIVYHAYAHHKQHLQEVSIHSHILEY